SSGERVTRLEAHHAGGHTKNGPASGTAGGRRVDPPAGTELAPGDHWPPPSPRSPLTPPPQRDQLVPHHLPQPQTLPTGPANHPPRNTGRVRPQTAGTARCNCLPGPEWFDGQ